MRFTPLRSRVVGRSAILVASLVAVLPGQLGPLSTSATRSPFEQGWGSSKHVPKAGRIEFAMAKWDKKLHRYRRLQPWKCTKKEASFQPQTTIAWVGRPSDAPAHGSWQYRLIRLTPKRKILFTAVLHQAPEYALVRGMLSIKRQTRLGMWSGQYRVEYFDNGSTVAHGNFKIRSRGVIVYGY